MAGGSEPASDAELVFEVRIAETLGEVTLLVVNDLATHHQDNARQDQQRPPASDEQTATDVGDRVGEVDRVSAEAERPGADDGGDLFPRMTVVFARRSVTNAQSMRPMPPATRASPTTVNASPPGIVHGRNHCSTHVTENGAK